MVRLNISTYDSHISNGFGKERFERLFVIGPPAVAGGPSFSPSGSLLGMDVRFFWNFAWWQGPYGDVRGRAEFSEKKKIAPNFAKMGRKWAKNSFFEFIEKLVINFY